MKLLKLIAIFCLIFSSNQLFSQDKKKDARNNLMGYGLAFCLHQYGGAPLKSEAGQALGGYFESGQHDHRMAYATVEKYFSEQMAAYTGVYKGSNEPAILMKCISIYQAIDFIEIIRKNDKYLRH